VRTGALILIVALASGCGGDGDASTGETAENGATPDDSSTDVDEAAMRSRLDEIAAQVAVWRTSDDLAEVRSASEAAANLIVGPQGPGYGDRDGDGSVSGENDQGLLPGLDGTPPGIASALADRTCVVRDVLAGTVDDPQTAWAEMDSAIDAWAPNSNTMPSLASHPMRIVGWSTFTLESDSIDEGHEYAGHAQLHVDVSLRALDC
jgi:hypothetical protein